MSKDLSKDVLGAIKRKTGKNISTTSVSKVASTVQPDTLENDVELRKLIKRVATMANIKLTDAKINEIAHTIQSSGVKTSNLESLMKIMMK
ncbi:MULTISPECIES: stage VI sporulation protein F [Paenibacillus]|uniref:stage VI sporulation protein F n=1 Tax=Paenibacillus TaxID=44249 RepID=UPI0020401D93|nr:stage VI sporulation protein F [Paenibacillus camelliae]MCM3633080.1 stage VI sporulation protein F [Paenibacillus camelliae]